MSQTDNKHNLNNELAKMRTRDAADRTLMAWTRTSISLIGFGFAIAQAFELYEAESAVAHGGRLLVRSNAPLIFGISFMLLGLFGLLAGTILYRRGIRQIRSDQYCYKEQMPFTVIIAIILVLIGVSGIFLLVR